jgi:hypothetical protein
MSLSQEAPKYQRNGRERGDSTMSTAGFATIGIVGIPFTVGLLVGALLAGIGHLYCWNLRRWVASCRSLGVKRLTPCAIHDHANVAGGCLTDVLGVIVRP